MFVGKGRGILSTSKLLKVDRQLLILEMLTNQGGSLRISEISKGLEASVVTVRRDVTDLARQGLVATTRGGVRLLREGTAPTSSVVDPLVPNNSSLPWCILKKVFH